MSAWTKYVPPPAAVVTVTRVGAPPRLIMPYGSGKPKSVVIGTTVSAEAGRDSDVVRPATTDGRCIADVRATSAKSS